MCSIIGYLGSSISAQDLRAGFDKTISRGPDDTRMLHIGAATLGFHRLAIMGLHPEGMQPFRRGFEPGIVRAAGLCFFKIRENLFLFETGGRKTKNCAHKKAPPNHLRSIA